ncbi:Ig-like domain-containing protein [Limnobacter humi]|uniref:Ig-like domain-containing protein n=1 Tax=Limnobacter humi TaxID=1778671 RepID=A0ABT1WFS3_9BURK|nr:Ig-like domain-containing protein [Limnobacter humi]MCQ8895896.1 Ig-like domain-containing protein [Limnobacter humi]
MSEKTPLPLQHCDPSTLGIARKAPKTLKKKPEVEWVVQMGPFTDGHISAPELVRPLEGPTDWVIKPKDGTIHPLDAEQAPEKGVIRKYVTVGAQDHEVPSDILKISDGYVVDRRHDDIQPELTQRVTENGGPPPNTPNERIITEIITKETRTVGESDGGDPPPCKPCDPCPPCEPQVPSCEPPKSDCDNHVCKTPIDAKDDCASTEGTCPVTIDVLSNDKGCGELIIKNATAEHGTVEVVNGELKYTAKEGFHGQDVITYTIGDHGCLTDSAHVVVEVKDTACPPAQPDCPAPITDCPPQQSDCKPEPADVCDTKTTSMHDQQWDSKSYDGCILHNADDHSNSILHAKEAANSNLEQHLQSWANAVYSADHSMAASQLAEQHALATA